MKMVINMNNEIVVRFVVAVERIADASELRHAFIFLALGVYLICYFGGKK